MIFTNLSCQEINHHQKEDFLHSYVDATLFLSEQWNQLSTLRGMKLRAYLNHTKH